MNNAATFAVYDTNGSLIMNGLETEQEACKYGKAWANGNGEGCVVVSSEDESAALHDVTPDYVD